MATIQTNLTCELQNGSVAVQYLNGVLFTQDNQANQINVAVYDNGEPATISGTVTANIIRADGGTVTATGGSISGNVASITMPSAAYAIPGVASIVVKLSTSGVVTTLAAVVANIYESSTATAIDPGTIIPSVTALVAQIDTAVASIPADYSTLWTTLAPAFSTSTNYAAGQYVTYNGGLYKFTAAHTGNWSASDVVAANIGNDLSDLKNAISDGQKLTGNLFHMDGNEWTYNGITVVNNRDGTFTANGTATASTYLNFCEIVVDTPKTMTAKIVEISGTGPSANIRFFPQDSSGSNYGNFGPGTHTREYVAGDKLRFRIAQANNVLTNFVFAIYVSDGDTAIEAPYAQWISEYGVRYDEAQTLTAGEKAQALSNISGASEQTVTNVKKSINAIDFTTQTGASDAYFEYDRTNECMFLKITGTWYLRGFVSNNNGNAWSTIVPSNRYTSTKGVTDCIKLTSNQAIVYDTTDSTWKIVTIASNADTNEAYVIVFWAGYYEAYKRFGIVGGIGQWMYLDYCAKTYAQESTDYINYNTVSYATQAKTVVDSVLADRDSNTITFGLITDTHHRGSYNAVPQVQIFNRMSEKCADFTVHLGDTIQGMQALTINYGFLTEYAQAQNDTFLPFMYTIAHHEMYGQNYSTDYLNDATAIPMSNVLGALGKIRHFNPVYSASRDNYYFDFRGVRFISLDSVHNTSTGFNSEAVSFLQTAVNTSNKIIVFAHVPANKDVNWKNKTVQNSSAIETALNGADVLAYFHGHTHWDNIVKVSGNNYPYIATCCALPEKQDSANFCALGTPTVYDRTIGDFSEYCFDIVNVHADTGAIKMFRFGVGSDRTYTQT